MRVYVPATTTVLRELVDEGRLAGPRTAVAVTPRLREFYSRSDGAAAFPGMAPHVPWAAADRR